MSGSGGEAAGVGGEAAGVGGGTLKIVGTGVWWWDIRGQC